LYNLTTSCTVFLMRITKFTELAENVRNIPGNTIQTQGYAMAYEDSLGLILFLRWPMVVIKRMITLTRCSVALWPVWENNRARPEDPDWGRC